MNAGLAAGMVADLAGPADAEDSERRAAWQLAGRVARTTLPILDDAEVVPVSALDAAGAPQPFASNQEAVRFASRVRLPAQPTFFDFGHPAHAAWQLTNPEPLRFDSALAWREGALLSVVPFWSPLNTDGSVKRDPDDALAGGPVMRVVLGPEEDVMDQLGPGTLGGVAEDGELYCWPEMPQGAEHSRTADRTLRCTLRLLDLLWTLERRSAAPSDESALAG